MRKRGLEESRETAQDEPNLVECEVCNLSGVVQVTVPFPPGCDLPENGVVRGMECVRSAVCDNSPLLAHFCYTCVYGTVGEGLFSAGM